MAFPEKGADRPHPPSFGAGLAPGLGVNLLVRDLDAAARWQAEALAAEILYWEDHFAVLGRDGSRWLLHSDWSYRDHEMAGLAAGAPEGARGAGLELRLYGLDPDAAEARARALGGPVLAGAADKPHGLREAHLVDPEGYVWVPCRPSAPQG